MSEVTIDPIVLYLMLILCFLAFCPPLICKLKQVFCTQNKIYDEDGTEITEESRR